MAEEKEAEARSEDGRHRGRVNRGGGEGLFIESVWVSVSVFKREQVCLYQNCY